MKMILAVAALALSLTACQPSADSDLSIKTGGSERVKIERIGVIEDALAYRSRRGIYIITDQKTGKEFIGVSGVGISETGSHTSGKATIPDEQ